MNKMETKEICHVCRKEKEPYTVILKDDLLSFLQHEQAREDGPICKRCDQYYAMTGELKDSTKKEFETAQKAIWFARMMLKWWGDINPDKENFRDWEGTNNIAKWCREELNKNGRNNNN